MDLLDRLNTQRKRIDRIGQTNSLDRYRQTAASMMVDANVHKALDVAKADLAVLERYGRNSFGYSLLMAR
ncbi:MAG: hypothetical protein ACKOAH_10300, partial [Pirellula sp.]